MPIQDSTFKQLRDFIYERCGIFVPDTKKYLIENRLSRRLSENCLNSFEEYLNLVKYSQNGKELQKLLDSITTNETYFFREPQQLDVLIESIIPKIAEKKKIIKIWSAACSTGEEPYTIAMLIKEKTPFSSELIASDISFNVLNSAKRAIYNSYSIRNVPENYLKKYFKPNGQAYELQASIKDSVKFMNINLVDDRETKAIKNMDIIFCRNVLIYFDDKAKQKAVSSLYDSLTQDGFLFIGASESLHNVTRAFRPVIINRVVVYQKV